LQAEELIWINQTQHVTVQPSLQHRSAAQDRENGPMGIDAPSRRGTDDGFDVGERVAPKIDWKRR